MQPGNAVLVALTDPAAASCARQLFSSAYFQGQWNGDFALIAVDLPQAELDSFAAAGVSLMRASLPALQPSLDSLPLIRFCKHAIFADFFQRWTTVVFIDSDVMIRGPIDALARVSAFSAVPAQISRTLGEQLCSYGTGLIEEHPAVFAQLSQQYSLAAPAFNSGVMAFPSSLITEALRSRLRRITSEYLAICPLEQVLLNLLFFRSWSPLPDEYNAPAGRFAQEGCAVETARILHFLGPENKPWGTEQNEASVYRDEWNANYRRWEEFSSR